MSKVILVTGSNSSIGFELVRLLAEKGHVVYLGARNEAARKRHWRSFTKGLTNVKFVLIDVRDVTTIERAKETIERAQGKLDVLVNNAAISRNDVIQHPSILDTSVLRDVLETNLIGLVQTTTTFLPLLRKSSEPNIVNVSSQLGSQTYQSQPTATTIFTAYANSKAAVNSYTVALARELGKEGFKVNAVSPGLVSSRLNNFIAGGKTLEEGAQAIVPYVLLEKDGPTGKLFNSEGGEGSMVDLDVKTTVKGTRGALYASKMLQRYLQYNINDTYKIGSLVPEKSELIIDDNSRTTEVNRISLSYNIGQSDIPSYQS